MKNYTFKKLSRGNKGEQKISDGVNPDDFHV